MNNKKQDLRAQLEAGMAVFLSQGKQISKVPAHGTRKKREPKEKFVEIEVEHLPPVLAAKHFPE